MTIPSTPRKAGPLLGNGVTTSFPFSFKVFAPTDVKVVIANSAGVETVLVLDSDYTVTLNANQDTSPGGTVNYPISGSPLPSGSVLSIIGNIDYDQALDLPSGGNFSPLALENQLDRTTMQIQQLREEMDRTVKLPTTFGPVDMESVTADVVRLADSANNIDTVANNIGSVNTVAGISGDVTTVAGVASGVASLEPVAASIPVVAGIAAEVATVATNVTDITNFSDVYQGAKAADPATRNDGSALQAGDLYFNTTTSRLRVFGGTVWQEGNAGSITVQRFSGTGAQTAFSLSTAPQAKENTQVYIGGVYQQKDQYSIAGNVLTFNSAPPNGTDNIEVVVMSVLPLGTTDASLTNYQPAGGSATNVQARLREIDAYGNKGRTHHPFANDYSTGVVVVRDGVIDAYHRHFGQIAEGVNGRLHLVYRRAPRHALTDGGTVYYSYSDDGGATWSAEAVLVPAASGFDQGSMSMCVTPSGRIVLVYGRAVAPAAAPTVIKLIYSDDNGATWINGADIVSIPYAYARTYGRIKVIPGAGGVTHRLVFTPYYQSSDTPTYKIAVWISDDDGITWSESTEIVDSTAGDNEAEMVAISPQVWFAAARGGSGIRIYKTTNGGATWSAVGIVPLTSTDNYVAPTLDKFYRNGRWYVLLGYVNRTGTVDAMTWRICDVESLLSATTGFSGALVTATDMENASGYQCPVVRPDGCVYFDEGTAWVEFKEYTGLDYTRVRFVRANFSALAADSARSVLVESGAIAVVSSDFEQQIVLDTEGAAATDDLDTINGGFEGQVVAFKSGTSSRDVVFKNGTGNLVLSSDFRLNTTDSRIVLRKVGATWMEVARSNDNVSPATALVIASDAITVPNSRNPIPLLIDTEGAAATDTLTTINGGLDGQIIILFSATSSRDITIAGGGNLSINAAGSFTLTNVADCITLVKRGSTWYEMARSDNA